MARHDMSEASCELEPVNCQTCGASVNTEDIKLSDITINAYDEIIWRCPVCRAFNTEKKP